MRTMTGFGVGLSMAMVFLAGCGSTGSSQPQPTASVIPVIVVADAPSTATATAPALDDILTAPVPSLCDHPPGTLVDGSLPGLPENGGVVELAGYVDGSWAEEPLVDTWVDVDGRAYAAAVINCNQGGVSWPQHVLIYDGDLQVIEAFDLADVLGDGRQSVASLSREADSLSLEVVNSYQDGDAGCCGTKDALVTIEVVNGWAAATVAKEYTEREAAQAAFTALLAGDQELVAELFTPAGLSLSRTQLAGGFDLEWDDISFCASASQTPEAFTDLIAESFDRACGVGSTDGSWGATITMARTGFGQWVSVGIQAGPEG